MDDHLSTLESGPYICTPPSNLRKVKRRDLLLLFVGFLNAHLQVNHMAGLDKCLYKAPPTTICETQAHCAEECRMGRSLVLVAWSAYNQIMKSFRTTIHQSQSLSARTRERTRCPVVPVVKKE